MKTMRVKEIMTRGPRTIQPSDTVREAAQCMKRVGCGVLPVTEIDRVIGIITDRDITVRVTAEGRDPERTLVQDVMTKKVYGCDENDDIEDVADKMRKYDVARLVVNRGPHVTGIVTMVKLLHASGNSDKGEKVLQQLFKPPKTAMACCFD